MKIGITGATGFIGQDFLIEAARLGHEITALVRDPSRLEGMPCKAVAWDANSNDQTELESALSGLTTLVHLAGEPIASGRWNHATRTKILDSRTAGTRSLIETISRLPPDVRPKTFVCASAIGFYGDRGAQVLTETSSNGTGFLSEVTQAWEGQAQKAETLGVRTVIFRFGIVLGRDGGALQKMIPVVLGSGAQWMSWIHLSDVSSALAQALEDSNYSGIYNLVAPEPASNLELTQALAQARGTNVLIKAPSFLLKSVLGEMSTALLSSTRVDPKRLLAQKFAFKYPTLQSALSEIYPREHQGAHHIGAFQYVSRPVHEVFSFFSCAENLEKLTPPWLNFKILSMSTAEIQESTLIEYQLKIHGVPVRWCTQIDHWTPDKMFVDTQLSGPYSSWHHTHSFEPILRGTLMRDSVFYQIPGGALGNLLAAGLVRNDVNRVFEYRRKRISEIFGD